MPEPKLCPSAEEAPMGPFAVEYHDNWPDMYHVSGQVQGEDDEENTCDDRLGGRPFARHDVRRRAVEFLPRVPRLMALAHSLMIDAQDRGELESETSEKARELLAGAAAFFAAVNAPEAGDLS